MEKEVSSDEEEESEESSESEEEEGDGDATKSDENVDEDDASIENDEDESAIDMFRTRFSRQPLSAEELEATIQMSRDIISIDGSTELLLTRKSLGDEQKDFHISEKDQSKLDEHFTKCAMKNLESSRKVLNQRWKRFNKQKDFTSRQAAVYTALSSYADMFSITKSMKVCYLSYHRDHVSNRKSSTVAPHLGT